jgi:hypothetical protein
VTSTDAAKWGVAVITVIAAGIGAFGSITNVPAETVEQIAEYNCERNADLRQEDYARDVALRADIREFVTTLPLAPGTSPAAQQTLERRALEVFAPGPRPQNGESCEERIEP